MDIPPAREIGTQPVDIETPSGIVHILATKATRGTGRRKNFISIEGYVSSPVSTADQCYFSFRGQRGGGAFSRVSPERDGTYRVVFETIISDPEFWTGIP